MQNYECGLCKLVDDLRTNREKYTIVYESENVIAIYATQPFAEVHIMIFSKKHIPTIFDLSQDDDELKLELLSAVRIASEEIIRQKGACKVEMYLGAFQQAKHLHCHVIYDSTID